MAENFKAKVLVNKTPVELNDYVEKYFASVSIGIVRSLKGVDYIKKVELHQEKGVITVKVNGEEIPITPFPNAIINDTLMGMLSPLKGIDDVNQLDIVVEA